jgi:SAM-dependent methyltransferase
MIAGKRIPHTIVINDPNAALDLARAKLRTNDYLDGLDIFDQMIQAFPQAAVELLAELYHYYNALPNQDRFSLYVARYYNFNIQAGDDVLDIGSGNLPFCQATHLADITLTDDYRGRAGVPFKFHEDKPVYECNVEDMPFKDQQFDFIYCSHVLEHVKNPEKACRELMRVGKRGYIETPRPTKDMFLNTAKSSHHLWGITDTDNTLIFQEYTNKETEGLQCDVIMQMLCNPETIRERALFALHYLKADLLNVMFLWENAFSFRVCPIAEPIAPPHS